MIVKLVTHTPNPDELAGLAAAKCTNAKNIDKARDRAMESGHESIAEHITFTFDVSGVSRVLLAQLTRHRLASFSVQSQRYVNQKESRCVIPPSIMENNTARAMFLCHIGAGKDLYSQFIEMGIPQEDARYVLAEATETTLLMTMNVRELRHFFSLRMCNRAQWEIRNMANEMYRQCKEVAPLLFADAGPGCVRGKCQETRPCGKPIKRGESV